MRYKKLELLPHTLIFILLVPTATVIQAMRNWWLSEWIICFITVDLWNDLCHPIPLYEKSLSIVAWVDVNKVKEMKKWLPLTSLSYLDSIRNLEIFINDYRLFWDGHADCRANAIFRYMYMFIVYMSVKSYCTVGR